MKYKSNITQKKLVCKAKSQIKRKNFLSLQETLARWISLQRERRTFIKLILDKINQYGFCSYSEETLRVLVGVSKTSITNWKKELKLLGVFGFSDPFRRPNSKFNHTTKIKAFFNINSFLSEYLGERTKVLRDSYSSYNSLLKNNPISLKGKTQALKHEEKQKQKQEKYELIVNFARKYRLHYHDQTLKLFVFPLHILRICLHKFNEAYQESIKLRSNIRRPFRYFLNILIYEMERAGLRIIWGIYYHLKSNPFSLVVKKVNKPQPPIARAPLPHTSSSVNDSLAETEIVYIEPLVITKEQKMEHYNRQVNSIKNIYDDEKIIESQIQLLWNITFG